MSIGVSGTNKVKTEPLGQGAEVRITEKMNELPEAGVRDIENNGKIVPLREQNQDLTKKLPPLPGERIFRMPTHQNVIIATDFRLLRFLHVPFFQLRVFITVIMPHRCMWYTSYLILSSRLGFLMIRLKGVTPRSLARTGNHLQIPDHEVGAMTALIPKG